MAPQIPRTAVEIDHAQVGGFTASGCLALYAAFGRALNLRITGPFGSVVIRRDQLLTIPEGSDEALDLGPGATAGTGAAAAIASALAEMADDNVTLNLTIDKGCLAADLARERGWMDDAYVAYFFLLDALVSLLEDEGLPTLDGLFFAAEARPTVVIVGEVDKLLYRGDLLTIVGEGHLSSMAAIGQLVRLPPDSTVLQKYRDVGRERLAFDFPLRRLTPLHLICVAEEGATPELTSVLRRALFHLGVLYTANRAHQQGPSVPGRPDAMRYLASYHERRRSARVALRANDMVNLSVAALADFARWPYGGEGRSDDRLDMLQRTFAQALPGDADENTGALLATLPVLLAEAKAQYAVFIDDQLDEYSKQRQGIADYAADVAKKVADSVDALTKGLIDTALATVAAVAVAILAAVANDKLRGLTFTFILCVYAAYVCFQALYRMLSGAHSMVLLHGEASNRLQGATNQLGERTVRPLREMLDRRWIQCCLWGIITAFAYFIITAVIVVLSVFGPQTTALRGVSTAPVPGSQPAATATVIPSTAPTPTAVP